MAKQTINIGASPNDGTGTPLRTAFDYTNQNFTELYTATGPSGNNIVVPGSATITGDLTVRTNQLIVNSSGVGVGTTPSAWSGIGPAIQVEQASLLSESSNQLYLTANGYFAGGQWNYINNASADQYYQIAGSHVWRNGTGGSPGTAIGWSTLMTLNATGLGVGVSPAFKLDVLGSSTISGRFKTAGAINALYLEDAGTTPASLYIGTSGDTFRIITGSNVRMNVDVNGNVGIGVTPSAWAATFKPVQIGSGTVSSAFVGQTNSPVARIITNAYFDGTNFVKVQNNTAGMYVLSNNQHEWHNAVTGTGTAAFVQAMTLDASGNLLLATTTNTPSARQYINQASGSNPALYIAGGASTTPLINFNGAGRVRSDGQYLVMETTNASGVIYVTANTNGVYLAVGGTSWTANSDERLKDIIEPISNAVEKVGSLRSVIGKFKNDETNTRRSFLIAQDVQAVFPEAVDASNPDKLGVAYTEVIPLLVAAIKELTAEVNALKKA
jgi:hypothetical protein